MKRWILLIIFLLMSQLVDGSRNILIQYVEEGLQSNLALKQKEFSLKKSLQALKEAKGMFLPSLSVEARYSRAGGGRIIEFPVGDMLNPIHQTLNQLLLFHDQGAVFPVDLENQYFPFLRPSEHETKVRLVQPLFQPAILFNYRIKSNLNRIQRAEVTAFKRKLVADIKVAYFNYLKTLQIKSFLENTKSLLEEHLRVSESLFKNQKVTEEIVFRANAEISLLDRQIAEAEKNSRLSAAYFNFLLNRPLDSAIVVSDYFLRVFQTDIDLKKLESHALNHRDEFIQLNHAIAAQKNSIGLYKSRSLPGITAVVDYGFQGETYRFTEKDDFWMASLVLSWNLFNGFQDSAKKTRAILEKRRLELQLLELQNKIRLQVRETYHNLVVARKSIKLAEDRLNSVQKTFDIVSKKYAQQMVPQIEYLQARNNHTNATINSIISKYECYIKEAHLEYVSGLYKIKNEEM